MIALLFMSLFGHSSLVQSLPIDIWSSARAFCTNADLSYKLSPIDPPTKNVNSDDGFKTWDFTIDDTLSGHKQEITGFGAAVTDATVAVFDQLAPYLRYQLLRELMTEAGANFALMRHTIGASDMTGDPAYTYNDAEGLPDPSLLKFGLGTRGNSMARLLSEMKDFNYNLEILGSSWSAPGWMKLNNALTGNASDNNLSDGYLNSNQTDYSESFAQYFVKYIQEYQKFGVDINAITIQNEPLNSQAGYPTMYVYDYEAGHLINEHIGPALRNAGLQTEIWAYDHNTDVPSYPETVLNLAPSYISAIAWHCYATTPNWTVLTSFHESHPSTKHYMTECWTPTTDSTNWFQAADFTLGPLQNWASGVTAWTLATDSRAGPHLSEGGCTTCMGLVTVQDDGTYSMTMAFYLMAQFSRYMPKGAVVLEGQGGKVGEVESVASWNPDGTRTVVVLNKLEEEIWVRVRMVGGEVWSGRVPGSSIVTWVLPRD